MDSLNILFVCRGNTCRSAIAEGIANHLLATKPTKRKAQVKSAGTEAFAGMRATAAAQEALSWRGISLAGHKATPLTRELVDWADKIFTMTSLRESQILRAFPDARPKVGLIHANLAIEDPIGSSARDYGKLAEILDIAIRARFTELNIL